MTRPVRVGVLGATGRMGRLVLAGILDDPELSLVAAVAAPGGAALGADTGTLCGRAACGILVRGPQPGAFGDAEVVVDFSLPGAVVGALPFLEGRALVSGTTGLDERQRALRDAHASSGPLLVAANFSLGIQVLLDLVARASRALPDADLEVVELHHRRKADAPSGTALALAAAAEEGRGAPQERVHGRVGSTGRRPSAQIGLHAVRGGDVVGEHTVWLLAEGERLALTHSASSRDTFAKGALRAAKWLAGRPPGRYALGDVVGLGSSA